MAVPPNIQSLLDTKADDYKAPEDPPLGTYLATIIGHEWTETKQNKDPMVVVSYRLVKAGEDLQGVTLPDGWNKRTWKQYFVFTPEMGYRFTEEFCQNSLGMKVKDRKLGLICNELQGKQFMAIARQGTRKDPNTGSDVPALDWGHAPAP